VKSPHKTNCKIASLCEKAANKSWQLAQKSHVVLPGEGGWFLQWAWVNRGRGVASRGRGTENLCSTKPRQM